MCRSCVRWFETIQTGLRWLELIWDDHDSRWFNMIQHVSSIVGFVKCRDTLPLEKTIAPGGVWVSQVVGIFCVTHLKSSGGQSQCPLNIFKWGFPKSWGYPKSSSISKWVFFPDKPSILGRLHFGKHPNLNIDTNITIHLSWLVVGPPLWKIWKSIGMISNPIYGKIKLMFQTTNQIIYHYLLALIDVNTSMSDRSADHIFPLAGLRPCRHRRCP